jgi:hypothetical protein
MLLIQQINHKKTSLKTILTVKKYFLFIFIPNLTIKQFIHTNQFIDEF